jgi:hypothetical protein
MSLAMLRLSRPTMSKIAPFEDIRASLRDAVCFWHFQTRAEARGYARLPLSRLELSALADGERSPARLPLSRLGLSALANGERSPARLPLSRQDLSAIADNECSPAIYRRVSVENERLVASRRLNRRASHRIR